MRPMLHFAVEHPPLAGAAGAVLAAVRNQQAGAQRCCQNSLIGVAGKDVAAGLEGDLGHETGRVKRGKTVKRRKLRILIVGAGDVARRLVAGVNLRPGASDAIRWLGLARSAVTARALREDLILPVDGDLDFRPSLGRAGALGRSAAAVLMLAPPPNDGNDDPRMRRWLAAVSIDFTTPLHSAASAGRGLCSEASRA